MFLFDIWGSISTPFIHGHKYVLTSLDDYSIFTWIILCKPKFEIPTLVQNFITMIETHYHNHVIVRSETNMDSLCLKRN